MQAEADLKNIRRNSAELLTRDLFRNNFAPRTKPLIDHFRDEMITLRAPDRTPTTAAAQASRKEVICES
jgi:hypothetical protein